MPTPLRFDSAMFSESDAEEVWRDSLGTLYELERPGAGFKARLESWNLGPMLLTRHFVRDEVQFQRTKRKIAQSGVDHYLVHCLLGGKLSSTFGRGEQRVALNAIAIRDLSVENIGFATDAPMLTLSIPRAALDRRMQSRRHIHAVSWDFDDPIGQLMSAHMRKLATIATSLDARQSGVAANMTLDILSACLLHKGDAPATSGDPRLAPMLKAQALTFIEQHLADPGLDPARIRQALGLSRTALYELFDDVGGVANHIRARRLDEAMRRLASPAHRRALVATISCAVGFMSESSFHRAFKERFGCTPMEARRHGVPETGDPRKGRSEIAAEMQAQILDLRA